MNPIKTIVTGAKDIGSRVSKAVQSIKPKAMTSALVKKTSGVDTFEANGKQIPYRNDRQRLGQY